MKLYSMLLSDLDNINALVEDIYREPGTSRFWSETYPNTTSNHTNRSPQSQLKLYHARRRRKWPQEVTGSTAPLLLQMAVALQIQQVNSHGERRRKETKISRKGGGTKYRCNSDHPSIHASLEHHAEGGIAGAIATGTGTHWNACPNLRC